MRVSNPNRTKTYLFSGGVLAIALLLAGCDTTADAPDSDRPDVVTTSTMITDWTARVGGDAIDLTGILEPGADPHVYEPIPQDSITLEEAELIFYNGYDLEPSLIRLINGTGVEARKVAVGEAVSPLDTDYDGERVPDPHVWGDVENAVVMVEVIQAELSALAPDQTETFEANAATFIAELEALDQWITEQINTIPPEQRKLVTTHDAFEYFTNAYGLESAGTLIGISTEEQPSAQTVQQLSETIQALGVPAIFAETTINPRLITTVAEEAGVTLAATELYSDSIGAPGSDGGTYIDMMTSNTRAIVENLGGTFTAFNPE